MNTGITNKAMPMLEKTHNLSWRFRRHEVSSFYQCIMIGLCQIINNERKKMLMTELWLWQTFSAALPTFLFIWWVQAFAHSSFRRTETKERNGTVTQESKDYQAKVAWPWVWNSKLQRCQNELLSSITSFSKYLNHLVMSIRCLQQTGQEF